MKRAASLTCGGFVKKTKHQSDLHRAMIGINDQLQCGGILKAENL